MAAALGVGFESLAIAGTSNTSGLAGRSGPPRHNLTGSPFFQGGSVAQRRKLKSPALASLDVGKKDNIFIHVRYTFSPAAAKALEPVTLTVSTPLPAGAVAPSTPLQERALLDLARKEVVKDLQTVFDLPNPNRKDVAIDVDIKRHPYADLQVGDRWQELHGRDNWEGLLGEVKDTEVDPAFRGEIMRYGEFAQATYDCFENDHDSKFCGNSMFEKEKLLTEVGLLNRGYEITDFIYATADLLPKFFKRNAAAKDGGETWSKDSNFMGFVAVCTDPTELKRLGRRDIVVAWRGTVTKLEWVENLHDHFSPAGLDPREKDVQSLKDVESERSEVMVESGFLSVYKSKNANSRYNKESAREQVLASVRNLVQKYKDEDLSITVTGHSLGSALAMLCAYDIAESGINKREHSPKVPRHWDHPHIDEACQHPDHHKEPMENRVPVSVLSFAGPRLGNTAFKARVEELGVKVLRVVNVHDVVPHVPGIIFNEKLQFLHEFLQWLPSSYVHLGTKLELDTNVSQYLKDTTDPVNAHNLEAYLHLLDGYHGPNGRFSPAVKRDIALVNKASDFLEPQFGIPTNWWEDRKMVMDEETGHWVVRES